MSFLQLLIFTNIVLTPIVFNYVGVNRGNTNSKQEHEPNMKEIRMLERSINRQHHIDYEAY
jgi:hypothetical protein